MSCTKLPMDVALKTKDNRYSTSESVMGRDRRITCQVCDVNKCLMSVSMLNKAEQREDVESGDRIGMVYEDKTYYLDVVWGS